MSTPTEFEDCMLWTGAMYQNGYGTIKLNKKQYSIHRLMYETYIGEIPVGYEIDHLCNNRNCFNIEHLELVTHYENMQRRHYGHKQLR